uniref:Uncharacterized protein n=1 Tax=Anopheles atroparvus TaxID=41427 RepID=A0A182J7J4_ANOAO
MDAHLRGLASKGPMVAPADTGTTGARCTDSVPGSTLPSGQGAAWVATPSEQRAAPEITRVLRHDETVLLLLLVGYVVVQYQRLRKWLLLLLVVGGRTASTTGTASRRQLDVAELLLVVLLLLLGGLRLVVVLVVRRRLWWISGETLLWGLTAPLLLPLVPLEPVPLLDPDDAADDDEDDVPLLLRAATAGRQRRLDGGQLLRLELLLLLLLLLVVGGGNGLLLEGLRLGEQPLPVVANDLALVLRVLVRRAGHVAMAQRRWRGPDGLRVAAFRFREI